MILFLVFFGTTINYIDRMVMGILSPDLCRIYHIDKEAYGYIGSAFAIAYALGQVVSGAFLDRVGTRIGYALALTAWSISSGLHALARGAWSFGTFRALLGVSESPNFPAATKTLAEWFPKKERALAMGFVNAGSNVGATLAPVMVPILAGPGARHWQWAFIATALLGVFWLVLWIPIYRRPHEHPRVNTAEFAHINSDPVEPTVKIPWRTLVMYPAAWAFAISKFLTDAVWWFYLTWLPQFLYDKHGIDLQHIGLPLVTVYLMADLGSIGGGWLSSSMIHHGSTINFARKTALFVCALCVVPIVFAANVTSLWWAVLLIGLATAAHQGFSSNLYTLVSDSFPKRAVASVAGFGGMFGYFGGSALSGITGVSVKYMGTYIVPFIIAACAYLVSFAVIHYLIPVVRPVDISSDPAGGNASA